MTKSVALSNENALTIAKNVLKAFKVLCENINVAPSEDFDSNFPLFTTVNCCSDKMVKIVLDHTFNGEQHLFQEPTNHIYKLLWYNRLFFVTFHTSPEVYGYSSALPEFDTVPYMFCSLIEMQSRVQKKYEMNFSFNLKTKEFLELFDIEEHTWLGTLKECHDTNYVERKLRGKILF